MNKNSSSASYWEIHSQEGMTHGPTATSNSSATYLNTTRAGLILILQSSHEPESFAEAVNHSCWRDAIQEEINAQEKKNKT